MILRALIGLLLTATAWAVPTAFAAPSVPAPAVVSAALRPVVNQAAARARVGFTFARPVCVREATPGRYICTAAHMQAGRVLAGYPDAWEVIVTGRRFTVRPSSVCPAGPGLCVNTQLT